MPAALIWHQAIIIRLENLSKIQLRHIYRYQRGGKNATLQLLTIHVFESIITLQILQRDSGTTKCDLLQVRVNENKESKSMHFELTFSTIVLLQCKIWEKSYSSFCKGDGTFLTKWSMTNTRKSNQILFSQGDLSSLSFKYQNKTNLQSFKFNT